MKKEYFIVFIIAGLGFLFGLFSLVNFLSKGKFRKLVKKKITIGATLLALTAVFTTGSLTSCEFLQPRVLYGTPIEVSPEPGDVTPTSMITPEASPTNEATAEPRELYAAPM